MSVDIRRSRPSDHEFIAELSRRVFTEYSPRPIVRGGATLIAEAANRPLGFVTLDISEGRRVVVLAIAVHPDAQGRGVGRRLMRAAEHHARARGATVLELCTAEANVAALDLFHKSGLGIVRRMRRYYARGQNACLLQKNIEEHRT